MSTRTLCAVAALALSACATTAGLEPTERVSGFDGARVVTIAPHGAACLSMVCTGLGAQWSAAAPGTAVLTVAVFNEIRGIRSAAINVDGRIVELRPAGLTTFSRPGDPVRVSRVDVAVPLQLVRDVASARRAWLRVVTTDGSIEDAIVDGPTDSKALHALRRFLAQIPA